MLTLKKFSGINNVLPTERLEQDRRTGVTPLAVATNVDIGLDGEILRREGFSEDSAVCHKNIWQADGFMLATADGGDLINIESEDVLYASLGVTRVWYVNLPDGRTTFSNGLINGITDGVTATTWGVPHPVSTGTASDVAGDLFPGSYQVSITHVRDSDGLESGPSYAAPFTIASGGISLVDLPLLDGHSTNVYLTSHNGEIGYLAGNTVGSTFSYTATNDELVAPCRTDFLYPAPVGTVSCFYSGRVYVFVGSVLYASKVGQFEMFDLRRDFKQFSADGTMVLPVDDGVYVGTEKELAFLKGATFDKLSYAQVVDAEVVLGSGVKVRGELIKRGDGVGNGSAIICIADSTLIAGFNNGEIIKMTEGRYATTVTEVAATFRMRDRIPQYIAIAQ